MQPHVRTISASASHYKGFWHENKDYALWNGHEMSNVASPNCIDRAQQLRPGRIASLWPHCRFVRMRALRSWFRFCFRPKYPNDACTRHRYAALHPSPSCAGLRFAWVLTHNFYWTSKCFACKSFSSLKENVVFPHLQALWVNCNTWAPPNTDREKRLRFCIGWKDLVLSYRRLRGALYQSQRPATPCVHCRKLSTESLIERLRVALQ